MEHCTSLRRAAYAIIHVAGLNGRRPLVSYLWNYTLGIVLQLYSRRPIYSLLFFLNNVNEKNFQCPSTACAFRCWLVLFISLFDLGKQQRNSKRSRNLCCLGTIIHQLCRMITFIRTNCHWEIYCTPFSLSIPISRLD